MTKAQVSDGVSLSLWVALTVAAAARAAVSDDVFHAIAITLFWASVYGAGLSYARNHEGSPPETATNGIAAVGLIAFGATWVTSSLLQGLMTLLLWIQAARNLGLKERRDAYFALAVGLALVVFAASEARSGFFVIALVAFGFAAFAALVYCHRMQGAERESRDQGAARAAADAFPLAHLTVLCGTVFLVASAWYLLVPRPDPIQFGVVPMRGGDQYSSESWEREARGGRPAGRSPGKPARPERGPAARGDPSTDTRPDDEIDITRSGASGAVDPNAIVMYVQAGRPLYMKRKSFDRFEGDRWLETDSALRKILPQEGEFNFPAPDRGEQVRYTVQIVAAELETLPLSAQLKQLVAPVLVIGVARDGAVHLPVPTRPGFGYAATSMLPADTPRPIAYDVAADPRPYLQLPADFSPRIAELAREVTARAGMPLERAVALESHLRGNYAYSFETVLTSQNVTPLDAFLFETRRGHCEFFASAMAVMLRSAGIPSRVVHGYLAHSLNPVTGLYEVRAFDGHAWVEALIEGRGWMTFEPTAAYPVPQRGPQTGTTLFDLKTYTEKLALQEALQGKWSLKSSLAALLRKAAEFWHALILQLRIALESLGDAIAAHAAALAGASVAAAALAAGAYFLRATLLLRWAQFVLSFTPAAKVPLAAFKHLERIARARRLGRPVNETADEYFDRLLAGHAAGENELNLLRRAFNAARYGGAGPEHASEVARAFSLAAASLNAS